METLTVGEMVRVLDNGLLMEEDPGGVEVELSDCDLGKDLDPDFVWLGDNETVLEMVGILLVENETEVETLVESLTVPVREELNVCDGERVGDGVFDAVGLSDTDGVSEALVDGDTDSETVALAVRDGKGDLVRLGDSEVDNDALVLLLILPLREGVELIDTLSERERLFDALGCRLPVGGNVPV